MANEYVSEGYKDRLRVAARTGRNEGVCHVSILSILSILQGGEIKNKTFFFRYSSVRLWRSSAATTYNDTESERREEKSHQLVQYSQ